MISDAVRKEALPALSLAAVELIEDRHDELVMTMPDDPEVQRQRMHLLRCLGADLMALGEAGLVLVQNRVDD